MPPPPPPSPLNHDDSLASAPAAGDPQLGALHDPPGDTENPPASPPPLPPKWLGDKNPSADMSIGIGPFGPMTITDTLPAAGGSGCGGDAADDENNESFSARLDIPEKDDDERGTFADADAPLPAVDGASRISGVCGGVCARAGVASTEAAFAAGETTLADVDVRRDTPAEDAATDAPPPPPLAAVGVCTTAARATMDAAIAARSDASARDDECAFWRLTGAATLTPPPPPFVAFCILARRRAPEPVDTAIGGVDRSAAALDALAEEDTGVLFDVRGGGGGAASVTLGDCAAATGGDPFFAENRA